MVEIKEVEGRIEVVANDYCEIFRTRAKAVMAARFLAEGLAATSAEPVQIRVPDDWGDPILVGA